MNQALLYVRVSSKEQEKEGFSLDAQQKLGLDYAKRKGFEIVKTWNVAESAWREERSSFNVSEYLSCGCVGQNKGLAV